MDGRSSPAYPYRAVIFDMDGVIIDSEVYYSQLVVDYGHQLGLDVSFSEVKGYVGQSFQEFCRVLVAWHRRAGVAEVEPGTAFSRYVRWERDLIDAMDYATLLNPGATETLMSLRERGVRTALASSSPLSTIERVFADCGLKGLFEVVVSGEQFRESKPNPEIYLHTVDCLGLEPAACCCVEDSVPGIAAGRAAGLFVIAKREERFGFSQDGADLIIDELPDLLDL